MENFRFETHERVGDTVGEVAYRRIRAHIVNGQLLPGEKLKLDRMKEVYGASVTTLREMLNRLAAEELALLPERSAIAAMLADYSVMRDQARVCSGGALMAARRR